MRLPKGPDMKFRLLKGPSLRLPKRPKLETPQKPAFLEKVNVPPLLKDLFGDMRDRHLLPLVAVAAAAIVAVPLLLSNSAPQLTETDGATGIPVQIGGEPPELTVVADTSGLRDYRKRLNHLEKKNPFVQHFSAPVLAGSQLGGTGAGTTTSVPTAPSTGSSGTSSGAIASTDPLPVDIPSSGGGDPFPSDPGGSGDGGGQAPVRVETEYVAYEIDVRIVRPESRAGGSRRERVSVRRGVAELEMLPGEKAPIVVFMGVSADRKKALFLVSEQVNSVFGDAKCMYGSESCQLLMIEPGLPVTFVYGARDKTLRLNLLDIEKVTREKP